jgi:ribonuclease G
MTSSDDGVKPTGPDNPASTDRPEVGNEARDARGNGPKTPEPNGNRAEGPKTESRSSEKSSERQQERQEPTNAAQDRPATGNEPGPDQKHESGTEAGASSSNEAGASSKEGGTDEPKVPRRPTRRGSRGRRGGARRGGRAEKFADKELIDEASDKGTEKSGEGVEESAAEGAMAPEATGTAPLEVDGNKEDSDTPPRRGNSRRGGRGGARRGGRAREGSDGTDSKDARDGAEGKDGRDAKGGGGRTGSQGQGGKERREPRARTYGRSSRPREPRPKIIRNVKKKLLVNSTPFETRIALIENGRLAEFHVERQNRQRGITGNIYKGKIVRVLPGMQSAFVEIGLARTAFFHVSDIKKSMAGFDTDDEKQPVRNEQGVYRIQDMIKEGQEVMVQVAKEPIGTKGARVTSYVSLPGRYLVFMPTYGKIAVSRRIPSDKERRRLKEIVHNLRPKGCGFIIRTVCEGVSREEIEADMNFLIKLWERIQNNRETVSNPGVLYEELDLTLRTIRDTFSSDIEKLIIDSKEEYERASRFINEFMPSLAPRVELYEGGDELYDANGVDIELGNAVDRKVWLRSGGHLVMDQMEALTAIDVNTGKYVGKKNSDQTILKTNLEAVDEVVYQLRLRNIGGIIVIDFIDMERLPDREKVYNELREALRADKARTNILKISELGIVEMTRKRTRESISQSLCEPCPYCEGNAIVRHVDTVIMDIYRDMLREMPHKKKATIYVSPAVAERFKTETDVLDELKKRFPGKEMSVKSVDRFHQERYEIF